VAFCFVHAGDLHLDAPFTGLRRVDREVADLLVDASLAAFDALVQLTIDRGAAFLLLAGGVYDGPRSGIRAQVALRRGLERLGRAGIATFLVLGDRDPAAGGWSAIQTWPPHVTVFGADRTAAVTVARGGEPIATVHGLSHARPGATPNLVRRFARTGGPGLHIGLLHADLDGAPGSGASPCTLDDLRGAGLDYWALGHAHRARVLAPEGDGPWVVEPGTLQGRGPAPAERGPKGAMVVTVDGTRVSPPEFVALDAVRLDTAVVDVTPLADLAEVTDALAAAGGELRASAGGRPVLASATLVGTGPVAAELRRPHADRALLDRLREGPEQELARRATMLSTHQDADPGPPLLWWERVTDATDRDRDLTALRQRGDLPAAVLAAADVLAADPDGLRAFAAPHLAPLGDLGAPDDPVMAWPAVTTLALDLLVGDR